MHKGTAAQQPVDTSEHRAAPKTPKPTGSKSPRNAGKAVQERTVTLVNFVGLAFPNLQLQAQRRGEGKAELVARLPQAEREFGETAKETKAAPVSI